MAKLIRLEAKGKIVFAGDTHGDSDSSAYILDKYLRQGCKIVFLGDYIDRGNDNRKNVEILFDARKRNPEYVFLLQGNHEGYMSVKFDEADFWERLDREERANYSGMFSTLPLAVSVGETGGIIATHGGIPDVSDMTKFDKIVIGDDNWKAITWGDFTNRTYDALEGLRPEFSEGYFKRVMNQLKKDVLIRSHDASAPISRYGGRCVTVFSSPHIARRMKSVAIADFDLTPEIRSIEDLIIEEWW